MARGRMELPGTRCGHASAALDTSAVKLKGIIATLSKTPILPIYLAWKICLDCVSHRQGTRTRTSLVT